MQRSASACAVLKCVCVCVIQVQARTGQAGARGVRAVGRGRQPTRSLVSLDRGGRKTRRSKRGLCGGNQHVSEHERGRFT